MAYIGYHFWQFIPENYMVIYIYIHIHTRMHILNTCVPVWQYLVWGKCHYLIHGNSLSNELRLPRNLLFDISDCMQVKDVMVEVVEGDGRNVLCEAVERHHASILVVGSHGYGAIKRY
jgi:hypothetical protein